MRVGVVLPTAEQDGPGRIATWAEILSFALRAEEMGLDLVWVCDHLYSNDANDSSGAMRGLHEAWVILSALAATTNRVEIGPLVTCNSFRNPALLAKMAVPVDEISGQRLTLGLGAGWFDAEYRSFGFPTDHKVSRLEEALAIMVPLLEGKRVSYSGSYYSVENAELIPSPSRKIPLLLAGKGARMHKLAAKHADAWNAAWFAAADGRFRQRLADFDAALETEDRDRASIRVTVGVEIEAADDPAAPMRVEALLNEFSALAVDDIILVLQPMTEASLARVAEALHQ